MIEKEIIAPSVVHTTVPVHERHHAAPEYHGASVLPPKTMTDFKATGQNLTSGTGVINQDQYEGCPRPYNPEMQLGRTEADADPHMGVRADGTSHGTHTAGMHGSDGLRTDSTSHGTHTAGPHGRDTANKLDPRVDSDRSSSHHAGEFTGTLVDGHLGGTGAPGSHSALFGLTPPVYGTNTSSGAGVPLGLGHSGEHGDQRINSGTGRVGGTDSSRGPTDNTLHDNSGHKKPSLLDKLNPRKDADGDGKPGFMK